MAADIEALFQKPVFVRLGAERVALFREFAKDIAGRSAPEIAFRYMKLNKRLSKENPLTEAERVAVAAAIKESLSDKDRLVFEKVSKLV